MQPASHKKVQQIQDLSIFPKINHRKQILATPFKYSANRLSKARYFRGCFAVTAPYRWELQKNIFAINVSLHLAPPLTGQFQHRLKQQNTIRICKVTLMMLGMQILRVRGTPPPTRTQVLSRQNAGQLQGCTPLASADCVANSIQVLDTQHTMPKKWQPQKLSALIRDPKEADCHLHARLASADFSSVFGSFVRFA